MEQKLNNLIENLQRSDLFSHPVSSFKVVETHISWVLLTGQYAYKIKKPLNFGFLDFTTLEKRHHFCQKELELNRRLAPEIYETIIPITGTLESPQLNGEGPVIEYAIKMKEFSQDNLFTKVLSRGELTEDYIEQLAETIAKFHSEIPSAQLGTPFGTPDHILAPVIQNFEQARPLIDEAQDINNLEAIQKWSLEESKKLAPIFTLRKQQGYVKECHGDIHLGNIILLDNRPVIFDCIEFNEDFRWTDVMSDVGFLIMDLIEHEKPLLANRLLNHYLEITGDYEGLRVIRYYIVYRAMVRAKIALFQKMQCADPLEKEAFQTKYRRFIKLIQNTIKPIQPKLFLMHGFSGSGKSTVAKYAASTLEGIVIRSDIERKRHFVSETTSLYTEANITQIYQHLKDLTREILLAGYPIIVDATFLSSKHRQLFQNLSNELNVDYKIIDCDAPKSFLIDAVRQRALLDPNNPSDAKLDVLERQLEKNDPLTQEELTHTITFNIPELKNMFKNIDQFSHECSKRLA